LLKNTLVESIELGAHLLGLEQLRDNCTEVKSSLTCESCGGLPLLTKETVTGTLPLGGDVPNPVLSPSEESSGHASGCYSEQSYEGGLGVENPTPAFASSGSSGNYSRQPMEVPEITQDNLSTRDLGPTNSSPSEATSGHSSECFSDHSYERGLEVEESISLEVSKISQENPSTVNFETADSSLTLPFEHANLVLSPSEATSECYSDQSYEGGLGVENSMLAFNSSSKSSMDVFEITVDLSDNLLPTSTIGLETANLLQTSTIGSETVNLSLTSTIAIETANLLPTSTIALETTNILQTSMIALETTNSTSISTIALETGNPAPTSMITYDRPPFGLFCVTL
jgi:hypothetical protein